MLNNQKLKELMKEKNIKSKRQLSKMSKIPYSTLIYMFEGHDMQVSTLIELSKFFGVPIDHLISKNFGVVALTEKGNIFVDTSNIIEATVSTMM